MARCKEPNSFEQHWCIILLQYCIETTVHREFFWGKIFRRLNFCLGLFSSLWLLNNINLHSIYALKKIFRRFNLCCWRWSPKISLWQKFLNLRYMQKHWQMHSCNQIYEHQQFLDLSNSIPLSHSLVLWMNICFFFLVQFACLIKYITQSSCPMLMQYMYIHVPAKEMANVHVY